MMKVPNLTKRSENKVCLAAKTLEDEHCYLLMIHYELFQQFQQTLLTKWANSNVFQFFLFLYSLKKGNFFLEGSAIAPNAPSQLHRKVFALANTFRWKLYRSDYLQSAAQRLVNNLILIQHPIFTAHAPNKWHCFTHVCSYASC